VQVGLQWHPLSSFMLAFSSENILENWDPISKRTIFCSNILYTCTGQNVPGKNCKYKTCFQPVSGFANCVKFLVKIKKKLFLPVGLLFFHVTVSLQQYKYRELINFGCAQ
jgi:hypothetical protein